MTVVLGLVVVVIVVASAVIFGRGGEVKETALTAGKDAADSAMEKAKEVADDPEAMMDKGKEMVGDAAEGAMDKGKEVMEDAKDEVMEEGKKMVGEAVKEAGENMVKEARGTGEYADYSADKVAAADGKVVLDFYADWCPSCRALDKDITANASDIPGDVTILKVDFDAETDLKKKYGVTQQHTLVQITSAGEQVAKWVGSPTLDSLLAKVE